MSNNTKENAANLAGFNGVKIDRKAENFQVQDYQLRELKASLLVQAIADCDPRESRLIMTAALEDLASGEPIAPFEDAQSDAVSWAEFAAPFEIESYFTATLTKLKTLAIGLAMRKRLFVALWEAFSETDRAAFIKKANPSTPFSGRVN